MIELVVEDYCQDCIMFDPEKTTSKLFGDDNRTVIVQTQILCSHRNICKHIYRMMERKYKNGQSSVLRDPGLPEL